MSAFTLRALTDASELSGFKCGIDVMDEFIRDGLTEELESTGCDSYILLDGDEVIAFFATCRDTLLLDFDSKEDLVCGYSTAEAPNLTDEEREAFISSSRPLPAIKIAYLAIRQDRQGKGIGTMIMNSILNKVAKSYPECNFVTVEALCMNGYSAVSFYHKFRFQQITQNTVGVRMYRTIIR